MSEEPNSNSFKTVWSVLDQAKYKAYRIRDSLQYLVDASEAKEMEDKAEKPNDPTPSINTLQSWSDNIEATLASCEKLLAQLRGNS